MCRPWTRVQGLELRGGCIAKSSGRSGGTGTPAVGYSAVQGRAETSRTTPTPRPLSGGVAVLPREPWPPPPAVEPENACACRRIRGCAEDKKQAPVTPSPNRPNPPARSLGRSRPRARFVARIALDFAGAAPRHPCPRHRRRPCRPTAARTPRRGRRPRYRTGRSGCRRPSVRGR
jgi:hypothetical protein